VRAMAGKQESCFGGSEHTPPPFARIILIRVWNLFVQAPASLWIQSHNYTVFPSRAATSSRSTSVVSGRTHDQMAMTLLL
jgi:hypothetical protein